MGSSRKKKPQKWYSGLHKNPKIDENLRLIQDSACGICGTTGVPLLLDHDHQTGNLRGLLCNACNTWLGHHFDKYDRRFLLNALLYVTNPPAKQLGKHPLITEAYIRCARCKVEKPAGHFYRFRRGGIVRFHSYCHVCMAEYTASRKGKQVPKARTRENSIDPLESN